MTIAELERLEAQVFGLIISKKVDDGLYSYDFHDEPCS